MNMKRTLLIGIDGASFSQLQRLFELGVMPNMKALSEKGAFRQMTAALPDNSAVSWSSIMTGTNPGEHGIFGFTDLIPGTTTLRFPNSRNLRAVPFWQQNSDRKYVIINLPFTYPAEELNGVLITGFVSPDINKSVYPSSLLDSIKESGYQTDADAGKFRKSPTLFLDELTEVLEARCSVSRMLFSDQPWDTFMLVFTGSDRLGHFLMDAWEEGAGELYDRYLSYYQRVDEEIGWLVENTPEPFNLLMMSDHGMERIQAEANINTLLEQNGLLMLDPSARRVNYGSILSQTQAFALEPSRVYIHSKGKYPQGSVEQAGAPEIINRLQDLFLNWEFQGRRVIKEIHTKDKIYSGACMAQAPDMVLTANTGFSLRGSLGNPDVFNTATDLTGVHRGEDSFLLFCGENAGQRISQTPHVEDILPIMTDVERN